MENLPKFKTVIEAEQAVGATGRNLSIDQLGLLARKLRWVTAQGFIMPPHEYVVEAKLLSQEEREAFESLRDSCAHHPNHWKAFFRAYKTKNSYLGIGDYRYWYSQIGAAKMMNRSRQNSELDNIRAGEGESAVKNWSGCAYAWKREYGLACENVHRYCNLVVFQASPRGQDGAILRYSAMVSREAVDRWCETRKNQPASGSVEDQIRRLLHGVKADVGVPPARSKQVKCSQEEEGLGAIWIHYKDMGVPRVAASLRNLSTAPSLEIERIVPLNLDQNYLVQLGVMLG